MEDEDMTEAEIDELFRATQPIGNALNALAQAELVVEAAATQARQAAIAAVPARLAALAESVSRSIDYETVAAWDGVAPSNPPPRPASARAIRGDSTWRTR